MTFGFCSKVIMVYQEIRMRTITSLICILLLVVTNRSVGQENHSTKELATTKQLAARGYTSIPISINSDTLKISLNLTFGNHKFRCFLDTGTANTVFSKELAAKLDLKCEKPKSGSIISVVGTKQVELTTVKGLKLENFEMEEYTVLVSDIKDLLADNDTSISNAGGLIGSDFLIYYSAIIDYDKSMLYLIEPIKRLWPALSARWNCMEMQIGNKIVKNDTLHETFVLEFQELGKCKCSSYQQPDTLTQVMVYRFPGKDYLVWTPTKASTKRDSYLIGFGDVVIVKDDLRITTLLKPVDDGGDIERLKSYIKEKKTSELCVYTFRKLATADKK